MPRSFLTYLLFSLISVQALDTGHLRNLGTFIGLPIKTHLQTQQFVEYSDKFSPSLEIPIDPLAQPTDETSPNGQRIPIYQIEGMVLDISEPLGPLEVIGRFIEG